MGTGSAADAGLLVPASYADQIALILEKEILQGRYRRGEHLQQDEICRRFAVSRTPAREALRKLQALGLVALIPNKGAMVQVPTVSELSEVYAVRAELEGFAAALAAEHRTDELVSRLSRAQEQLSEAVGMIGTETGPDRVPSPVDEQLRAFNDTFHELIHSAGGNQRLQGMIHDLQRYFPKDTVRLAITLPSDLRRFYVAEHDQILTEILNGRHEGARDAMRHHIHQSQLMLLDYLQDIGFDN